MYFVCIGARPVVGVAFIGSAKLNGSSGGVAVGRTGISAAITAGVSAAAAESVDAVFGGGAAAGRPLHETRQCNLGEDSHLEDGYLYGGEGIVDTLLRYKFFT